MMHHSRTSAAVIDCPVEDLAASTEFWSRALGRTALLPGDDPDLDYVELRAQAGEAPVWLRHADQPGEPAPCVETDDLEAEVLRLEKLGAHRVTFLRGRWWGMQSPGGERFTVVKARGLSGHRVNCWR